MKSPRVQYPSYWLILSLYLAWSVARQQSNLFCPKLIQEELRFGFYASRKRASQFRKVDDVLWQTPLFPKKESTSLTHSNPWWSWMRRTLNNFDVDDYANHDQSLLVRNQHFKGTISKVEKLWIPIHSDIFLLSNSDWVHLGSWEVCRHGRFYSAQIGKTEHSSDEKVWQIESWDEEYVPLLKSITDMEV